MDNKYIINVYVDLIIKNEKTLDEVPEKIRNEVKKIINKDA